MAIVSLVVPARAAVNVGLVHPSREIGVGEIATYSIVVSGLNSGDVSMGTATPALGHYFVEIDYNKDVASLVGTAFDSTLNFLAIDSLSTPGEIILTAGTSASPIVGQATTFTLATFQLRGIALGPTALTFGTLTSLSDANAQDIAFTVGNGSLTVVPEPTNYPAVAGAVAYAPMVLTNNPIAYWRLNDTNDPSSGTAVVLDSSTNGANGTYGMGLLNGFNGIQGPIQPAFPGFGANNFALLGAARGTANAFASVPVGNLGTNTVTFTMWVNPSGPQPPWAGLLMSRGGPVEGGVGMNDQGMLAYTWNNNTTWSFFSGLSIPQNQWSFVAVAIGPIKATLYLNYVDTVAGTTNYQSVVNSIPHVPQGFGTSYWRMAADFADGSRNFNGYVDEVAVFGRTLSNSEIAALFDAALGITPPAIVLEPTPTARYAGLPATFKSVVTGSSLSYQWFKGSQALGDAGNVSGAKTASLTLSNVESTDVGSYTLVAANSSGAVTSSVVTLVVQERSLAAYERAVLAANPISYWRLNETNDASSRTLLAYDYVGGFSGTYGTSSQDGFNNVAGPRPTDGFAIFETNNTAMRSRAATDQSWVTARQPTLNTNAATFTMWVYPDGDQAAWAGLLMNRSGDGEGVGLTGGSDDMLVYTWNSNSTWSFVSGLTVPSNQWSFLTVAVEPTRAILYVANTNGMRTATNPIVHVAEPWGGSADIGNDPGFSNGRVFNGIVDEVAIFNYTLSPQQVQNLFQGTSTASRPTLTITTTPGDKLTINWDATGTLQSAPSLQGASTVWTDLGTTNPLTVTPTGTAQFYRVRSP